MSPTCSKCAAQIEPHDRFCGRCGSFQESHPLSHDTPSTEFPLTQRQYIDSPPRATTRKVLAFVGIIFMLALAYYFLDFAFFREKLLGPAKIQFGSKYIESSGKVLLERTAEVFPVKQPMIAWVAHLNGSVNRTSVDLVLSKLTDSGGERVLAKDPLNIADPAYNILYGIINPFTLILGGSGTYRFRVASEHTILAQGEFRLENRTPATRSKRR